MKRLPHLASRRAFTLIELLVVIVIIALLMAIAIPAYLSQQVKAKDTQAKHALAIGFREARSSATGSSTGGFPPVASIVADYSASEPGTQMVSAADCSGLTAADPPTKLVVDSDSTPDNLAIYSRSSSGTIWRISSSSTAPPVTQQLSSCAGLDTGGWATDTGGQNSWFGGALVTTDSFNLLWGSAPAGSTLFAAICSNVQPTSFKDSLGNPYQQVFQTSSGGVWLTAYEADNSFGSPSGTTVTWTHASSNTAWAIVGGALQKMAPVGTVDKAIANPGTGTSISNSITTTHPKETIVAMTCFRAASLPASNVYSPTAGGFTNQDMSWSRGGTNDVGLNISSKAVGASGNYPIAGSLDVTYAPYSWVQGLIGFKNAP